MMIAMTDIWLSGTPRIENRISTNSPVTGIADVTAVDARRPMKNSVEPNTSMTLISNVHESCVARPRV